MVLGDLRQCWDALATMWFLERFTNCLRQGSEVTEEVQDSEGEYVVLSWNENTKDFIRWSDPEATNW